MVEVAGVVASCLRQHHDAPSMQDELPDRVHNPKSDQDQHRPYQIVDLLLKSETACDLFFDRPAKKSLRKRTIGIAAMIMAINLYITRCLWVGSTTNGKCACQVRHRSRTQRRTVANVGRVYRSKSRDRSRSPTKVSSCSLAAPRTPSGHSAGRHRPFRNHSAAGAG
jgi:hypothetical protein